MQLPLIVCLISAEGDKMTATVFLLSFAFLIFFIKQSDFDLNPIFSKLVGLLLQVERLPSIWKAHATSIDLLPTAAQPCVCAL